MIRALLIALLVSSLALGDCQPAVNLKVGDTVKDCDRVGLSIKESQNIQQELVEKDYQAKEIEEGKHLLDMKDLSIQEANSRADLFQKDSARERLARIDAEKSGNMKLWVGMGIGAGVTLLLLEIAAQAIRAASH